MGYHSVKVGVGVAYHGVVGVGVAYHGVVGVGVAYDGVKVGSTPLADTPPFGVEDGVKVLAAGDEGPASSTARLVRPGTGVEVGIIVDLTALLETDVSV